MFSTALVIFRETLEISLILGIVLAATRGLPQRGVWIAIGFMAGGAGAGLIAYFAQAISDAAEGMGQELFNAGILFAAALVIGWTVIWMRRHAREMAANLKKVGQEVMSGNLPRYSLSLIIGLAMLREVSEMVLFVYGIILSGENIPAVTGGCALGVLSGGALGAAIYLGLIRLPVGKMMQYTSWLLMLLVAGLAAQGIGFLSAAGYFGQLSAPLWDSSWLLSDGSLAGKALHTLIGYSAKPSVIQAAFYAGTLGFLFMLVSLIDGRIKPDMAAGIAVGAIVLAFLTLSKPAAAADTIHSPNLVKGEAEFEYNGSTTIDRDHADNNNQEHEISVAYTPAERWKTEFATIIEKENDGDAKVAEVEWENFFQFWEQAFGGHSSGGQELSFLWSTRHRLNEHFQPGFEIQSAFGQNGDISGSFDKQKHAVGPAAYDLICHNVKCETALLLGISDAAADAVFRFKLEFEKFF